MDREQWSQFGKDSDRLFSAIGHVVVAFQLLELWVAEALSAALNMNSEDDRHLVSAAMSYKQKVDLMFELYARHGTSNPRVKVAITKRAMLAAEEFRNRVVHSVWAVTPGVESSKHWVRTKASLRGKSGFELTRRLAQAKLLEEAATAMNHIRAWEEGNEDELLEAIKTLSSLEPDAYLLPTRNG